MAAASPWLPTLLRYTSFSPSLSSFSNPNPQFRINPKSIASISAKPTSILPPISALSDPFVLQVAESLEDSLSLSSSSCSSSPPPPLQKLRDFSSEFLLSLSWPSRKDEPFRFTDLSFIRGSEIQPIATPPKEFEISRVLSDTQFANVVIVDGFVVDSEITVLPEGVFVGRLSELQLDSAMKRVSELVSSFEGDLFWSLNGVGAPDLVVVYVPEGCRVENPLHLRYYSGESGDFGSRKLPVSNPRVLVLVEKGGEIGIVEEFIGDGEEKFYWTNSVFESVIGEGGTVSHSYIQSQSMGAAHTKWTSVRQESGSTYKLVEVSSGGKLSRHNVNVQQVGPDTVTELSTLHLSVGDQTQDLHSRLVLDHPRGYSQQLHKCIVAHPQGQAVFDGNIRVNRYAQQTDAGQLTRTLLLVPRATVNVKPNLQIVADDVKCSHGAAISDLEEDQMFYFRARGVDSETARRALIFSFGAEVIQRIPLPSLRDKVKSDIAHLLEV